MLKATDPHFIKFGEIYFSCGWPGAIKAWHIHQTMTLNEAVIVGRMKLVLYNQCKDSPAFGELMEPFIGEDCYCLVQIPPGVASGYKAYGDKMAVLANRATEPHDPNGIIRIDSFSKDIPYQVEVETWVIEFWLLVARD